jgi:hypothetical protein
MREDLGITLVEKNYIKEFLAISAVIILMFLAGCSGCVESGSFVLDEKSTLPIWFDNNDEMPRSNYHVRIIIYEVWSNRPGKVKIIIKDANNKTIDKATGLWKWHQVSSKRIENGNAFEPTWSIATVRGTEEIYEHSVPGDILKIVPASAVPDE